MQIIFIHHSCFLVELDDKVLIFDYFDGDKVEVFSATSTIAYKNANHWAPIVRHATFLLGGFVMVLLLHNIPCRFFSAFIILLPVSMLMLIVTPFIGVDANDAHRWLEIMGIQFQPSEFGKLACVVFVAF